MPSNSRIIRVPFFLMFSVNEIKMENGVPRMFYVLSSRVFGTWMSHQVYKFSRAEPLRKP